MINTKNRLLKFLKLCRTYGEFEQGAINRTSWLIRPYVEAGEMVTKIWLQKFWTNNGGKGL